VLILIFMWHHRTLTHKFVSLQLFLFLHAFCALAQIAGSSQSNDSDVYNTAPGTGVLIFSVFSEKSGVRLDRQALIKLVRASDQSATWQTTDLSSRSVFANLAIGNYEAEISAVGYLTIRQTLSVSPLLAPRLEIILHRDPAAVNLDVAKTILSPKARKQAKKAISLLKVNNPVAAQGHLEAAYKIAPSSTELNFLLGYLYFQTKDFARAENYLAAAINLDSHNAQALTLLGRTRLEREQYFDARSVLEQAVIADSANWLPHNLLATAYFREKNYDKACSEARLALEKAKQSGVGPVASAQLVLGESLIGLGRDQEGIEALKLFLEQAPHHPMTVQVRALLSELETRARTSSHSPSPPAQTHATVVDPLAAIPDPVISSDIWQIPNVDDVKPLLASGVECSPETVIDEAGKRVQELVQDLTRFAAVEDLFHQSLDSAGLPLNKEIRKYDYIALLSEPAPGTVTVAEYRSSRLGMGTDPDGIASTGFAGLALVFHPDMRKDFDLSCEGLAEWQAKPAWLVRFRQRSDRPNRMHSYQAGTEILAVDLKGVAWIAADTFQIMRIEADLIKPIPEIQLLGEHQAVEYGPVPFPRKNITLWLPKQSEIYFKFKKHNYYRRHSFDHYMLFSVDAEEKRKEPSQP